MISVSTISQIPQYKQMYKKKLIKWTLSKLNLLFERHRQENKKPQTGQKYLLNVYLIKDVSPEYFFKLTKLKNKSANNF